MEAARQQQSLAAFIRKHRIRMVAELTEANPNMTDMPRGSNHWKCVLRCGRRSMTVPFSQGPAICREPTAEDVLDCMSSDASGYENARSFEEWAGEYGYDTDSRKAERVWNAVERQSKGLRRLLGSDEAYKSLLWNTERL